MRRVLVPLAVLSLSSGALLPGSVCAEPPPAAAPASALPSDLQAKGDAALAKAAAFLKGKQREDGSIVESDKIPTAVGFTAMSAAALVGATPKAQRDQDPTITKALAFVAKNQKESGAIFTAPTYTTYETSAAVAAFAIARRPEHRAVQTKGRDFLAQSQIGGDENSPSFGGFPYQSPGKKPSAADLSNLQFAVDALARGELPSDSPVWKRVQAYLKRVQNSSERNPNKVEVREGDEPRTLVAGDDGGGTYAPDQSKAGMKKRADGTYELKSYGSMTYALVKCLLLSGVDPKDPRVLAALTWLSNHWTLDRNPGFEEDPKGAVAGMQGYYYFLFTGTRALALYEKLTGKPLVVRDADGHEHDWRKEMVEKLLSLQGADGTWVNPQDRWNESSPVLVTAYAAQALATALGKLD